MRELQHVCIQGLGFVGAAMAVAVAAARDRNGQPSFRVTGVDLPTPEGRARITALAAGRFPFATTDPSLGRAAAAAAREGRLTATDDPTAYESADVVVVDVNLDVAERDGTPAADLDGFRDALSLLGRRIRPDTLVLVETTVPPGTCERVAAPALAAAFSARGLAPDAFRLAHSFERVMPGPDYLRSITHFWRVYAGHTPAAAAACEAFLKAVVATDVYPLTRLATTTASETAKVLENAYRAANIALIAEWGRFADAAGVDLFQVLDAIRLRPTHANIRQPGFGVGGYCLTKDPLMGGIAARDLFGRPDLAFPFADAAVATNRAMPLAAADRLETLLGGTLQGKRVLLLGVTYREGVADTRHSPSATFVMAARARGATVVARDPLLAHWRELDLPTGGDLPAAGDVDAVVFAVAHDAYRTLDVAAWMGTARPAVLDANAVLDAGARTAVAALGGPFAAIGRGVAPSPAARPRAAARHARPGTGIAHALITGGAGFIGGWLAAALADRGVRVTLVDNFARGRRDGFLDRLIARPEVRLHAADLTLPGALDGVGSDVSHVFHFAARLGVQNVVDAPGPTLWDNAALLQPVLAWARVQEGLQRLLFASTSEVYAGTLFAGQLPLPTPEDAPLLLPDLGARRTSYMLSKIYGEAMVRHAGLPFTIVRPHNVYGPRMGRDHVVPQLLEKAHRTPAGGAIEVYSVEHSRTFCFVDDAVEMLLRAALAPSAEGAVLNLGRQAPETRVGALAQAVVEAVGKPLSIRPMPATEGSPVRRVPDMTRMTAATGYAARIELKEGVARTWAWYRRHEFAAAA